MNTSKSIKRLYWTITVFLVVTMVLAGVLLLIRFSPNVEGITRIGYPAYICTILGIAKILGGIGILQNKNSLVKEWAYAGYIFNLLGATASHLLAGSGVGEALTPAIICLFVLASYWCWKKMTVPAVPQVKYRLQH